VCGAKKEGKGFFVGSEGCDVIETLCNRVQFEAFFVCFGAASPRTLSSGRKGAMLASRVGFMALWQARRWQEFWVVLVSTMFLVEL
jgi:hypothetical protein